MPSVPLPVALAPIACAAALFVILLGQNGQAATRPAPRCALAPITARSTVAELARHFGRPTWSRFRSGSLSSVWVAKTHNWTVVRYIHPRQRPNP